MSVAGGEGLHFVAEGEGPGLLFIHGAGGNAAVWWQQAGAFAPSHRVVAYDLAGFGRSGPLPVEAVPQRLAADAAAVLDRAGVERATVVCQSLGGWSGVRLALERPERVERLVMCATPGGVVHMPAVQSYIESTRRMDERGPVSLALSAAFAAAMPSKANLYQSLSAANPPLDRAVVAKLFSPEVMLPPERLAQIACPVLIIAGEEDPIWPPAALEGMVAHFPSARMEVIPGTGHSAYFEVPERFNAVLRAFLG